MPPRNRLILTALPCANCTPLPNWLRICKASAANCSPSCATSQKTFWQGRFRILPIWVCGVCGAFSDLTDAFLTRLLALACARAGVDAAAPPLALVATGGYGRRELCPYSDIDLTFVPLRDADPRIDRVVRDMFTQIMDICIGKCGLKVGYAYRLLEDCAGLDHQTATGLLDARLIAGSERLFIQFEDAFWDGFNSADFVFTKLAERRRVLARWGSVAPRGGTAVERRGRERLRDAQTAVWLVQAHERLAAARVRGPRSLESLHRAEYLTLDEATRLGDAKEMLFRTRNILHAIGGAARDTLVRTRQEDIAERLGYDRLPAEMQDDAPPVERFMADLYPKMALVRRVAESVMQRVENSRMMLGIGLDCRRSKIVPANGALETDDPLWLLWACELAQKYGLAFGERLVQACEGLLAMKPVLSDPCLAAQIFTRILGKKGQASPILQTMADLGILGWYVPEFGRVMELIPYDPAHEFTVGQHTLNIVRYLDQLADESAAEPPPGQDSEQWAEMRRVMQELGHPEQLMLAALLHDCGKALPGGTHADIGGELAERVCRRLEWDAPATSNVVFLIRRHLLMAETSRLRDLTLDETIQGFAGVVNDSDRLDMLYLLTYADTRAVGEAIWTPVNGRYLQELWQRAAVALQGEPATSGPEERLARARRRMVKDLKLDNLPEDEVTEHVQAMPPPYLLNQELERIALHIALVRRVRQGELVIDFFNAPNATYTELTVCAYDDPRPGLLAKITGVLYAAELSGLSAQVFTRVTERDRIALDTLWVDFRGRQLSGGKQQEVAKWLRAVLLGEETTANLLQRRQSLRQGLLAPKSVTLIEQTGRAGGANGTGGADDGGKTRVLVVHNDLSSVATVIEIAEPDVQGALFWTSQALARLGWNIQSARVSIFHGAARASFYVTGARQHSEDEIRQKLTEALRGE